MKVTINTSTKVFEVCTEGELIDFNNLTLELLKTIERCKGTITIPNNPFTTGIPVPCRTTSVPLQQYPLEKNSDFINKSSHIRSNFQ